MKNLVVVRPLCELNGSGRLENILSDILGTLENEGVFEELKKMGCKEGDTVKVCELEFDYYD